MVYTANLSGSGEASLSGIADVPEYILAHVITAGPMVRTPFDQAPDLLTKVGWLQLGDQVDLGFGLTGYWNDPIWINGRYWQFMLPAGQHYATTRLKWWMSPGTEVYVMIAP